jgi:hypothetical protein
LTGHLKRNRFVIHAEKSGQSGWRDVVSPPHAAIWGFLQKKQRHVGPYDNPEYGDVWTFCVIDAESKLVPSFKVGKRDLKTANVFVDDLAGRLSNRVQISSDGLRAYVDSIEQTFGADVDYGQIIKTYQSDSSQSPERKYSPPRISSA